MCSIGTGSNDAQTDWAIVLQLKVNHAMTASPIA